MNADKTPTTDGLPVKFYKAFWDNISTHLLSTPSMLLTNQAGCLLLKEGVS